MSAAQPTSTPASRRLPGFLPGWVVGSALAGAWVLWAPDGAGFEWVASPASWTQWLMVNLGHSIWAFAVVIVCWAHGLRALEGAIHAARSGASPEHEERVARLDQLTDVWTHLFVGIGVVWTAIGMRAALQVTLGDPDAALQDSAGNVLRGLVDGGILLALTTTIVGAVGGYLMRLGKTLWLGGALHQHFERLRGRELGELLASTHRIERAMQPSGEDLVALGADRSAGSTA